MEKQSNNQPPQHETHTGALIFLSLTALVVVGVAYSSTRMPDTSSTIGVSNADRVAVVDKTAEVKVGQLPADASPLSGMQGFPSGFSLPTNTQIVENYEMPIETGETERVLTYDSASSTDEVRSQYLNWLAENGFAVVKEKRAELAASVAALNADDRDLIVLISNRGEQGGSRVQVVTHYDR